MCVVEGHAANFMIPPVFRKAILDCKRATNEEPVEGKAQEKKAQATVHKKQQYKKRKWVSSNAEEYITQDFSHTVIVHDASEIPIPSNGSPQVDPG